MYFGLIRIGRAGLWGTEGLPLYANSSASRFHGTSVLGSICVSKACFQKKLKERGYDPNEVITVKAQRVSGLAYFAIILSRCYDTVVFDDGGLPVFIISLIAIFLRLIIYGVPKKEERSDPWYARC